VESKTKKNKFSLNPALVPAGFQFLNPAGFEIMKSGKKKQKTVA